MSASYKKWLKDKLVKLQAIDCYTAGASPETSSEATRRSNQNK